MNKLMLLMCMVLITFQSHSAGMYENAKEVGINGRCLSELKSLTDYLKPSGFDLNLIKTPNPSKHGSTHIGLQKNLDGSTAHIVSLNPKNSSCSYSYSKVVTLNTGNCNTIKEQLTSLGSNLKIILDEKGYTAFKNSDNNAYFIMIEPSPTTCTFIETQAVFKN
jgi:hypothetical protein